VSPSTGSLWSSASRSFQMRQPSRSLPVSTISARIAFTTSTVRVRWR
jgi:hypothetical protein